MSTTVGPADRAIRGERSAARALRDYFFSDATRSVQTVLGLFWLIDGLLQFQSFMYSNGFYAVLRAGAIGQPGWLHDSVIWGAGVLHGNPSVWNTLFALTQCLIGIGVLYRPTVKTALAGSFAWAFIVWWFGEAFGMLFMNMAQPMTGAPGAVLLYALIGLIAWPNARPGGLLGASGARITWAALWLVSAWAWLLAPSSSADASSQMLGAVKSGIGPLEHLQNSLANAAVGDGLVIALVLAALSATIAIAVAAGWRARFWLYVSIALNLAYWLIPQGLGGIFTGQGTDLNAGPLFILLAVAMIPLTQRADASSGDSFES